MKIKVDNSNHSVIIEDITFVGIHKFDKENGSGSFFEGKIILSSDQYLKLQQLFLDQWYN